MKTVVITKTVDDEELAALLEPRTNPMIEIETAPGEFDLEDGPFDHYRRVVSVDEELTDDGRHTITETTEFVLAIPVWGWMFSPLVKRAIKNPPKPDQRLWWLPPDRIDKRATEVLAILCVFSVFTGYLGVMLSQLNPYFKAEFDLSNSDISFVLMAVRLAGILALAVSAFADRRGRKTILLFSTYCAIAMTVLGAFAPNIFFLGASQTLSRTFSAAIGLIIGIMAAEEMPAGGRAFAVSMLVASGALGAGGVVVFLHVADLSQWSWRIFFLVPLLMIIPARRMGARLPESRRFELHELNVQREKQARLDAADAPSRPEPAPAPAPAPAPTATASTAAETPMEDDAHPHLHEIEKDLVEGRAPFRSIGFRFAVLAASAFLINIFAAPANGFFNEFLKTEQGYDGLKITGLQVITNLPGGISMIVGGRLAESRGRRIIGAFGTVGGFGFTVLMFLSTGAGIWLFSTLGTLIGAIAIPALGVYGAELFPTGSRGLAGGGLNLFGVAGGVLGLLAAGALSDHYGSFGPTMAILGLGPLVVVFLILFLYPETAHRELEELNPEDAPPPHDPDALHELDDEWIPVHEAHVHHGHGDHSGDSTPDPDAPEATGSMTPRV